MLGRIVYFFTNKEIVVYSKHRQTLPLLNELNKKKYVFIDPTLVFKATYFLGRKSLLRYRTIALILSFISPKYIIDINWISKLNTLYYIWCRRSRESKFIVIQHGSYCGGIIRSLSHRYSKCQIMWCWSSYFCDLFYEYNRGKDIKFLAYGNPVYNVSDRSLLNYKNNIIKSILVIPSVIFGDRREKLICFLKNLENIGFLITLKEHNFQSRLHGPIKGFENVKLNVNLALSTQEYDLIITDISTSLLDSVFFKNKILFFSPEGKDLAYTENIYAKYLINLASAKFRINSKDDLISKIDLGNQENLFRFLINKGTNNLAYL